MFWRKQRRFALRWPQIGQAFFMGFERKLDF
jgi:hypothetical protein